ncbi:MAG: 50S ribosomal protein L11 methyltransferase [Hydrogenophilales bacterium CG03_land_8_20_14_0_80_62_28]|nr:50S ribosomal protein L11 methyltransferase [Betaproteobacteria bacterium]OIO76720.1 MAG: ribosomal protein L11 methyltransferase [Hydrogenophilaceae bacterium CG1_02_62_390]PIV23461.1 MAG: 50S ribosomal protein L11 methyltransferase [Hydrogenophilales bacterium CG03_land_8_20_14_0_80_62_28]PIW38716.1 MAG: 50S ribosomal protein L11 methyltransferase [Hydrogenophilales bacterium CG15_BIG_FIL_POST_REV_8_21_14_020_62_31]PIW71602.1 MAG: 50S ribosomal protein L11 methyltransferase [Hydrogenophila
MTWLSLKLAVDGDQAEALSDALLAAGALAVSTEDRDAGTEAEEAQFGEPGLADLKSWRHNWVVALLDGDADVPALLASLNLPEPIEYRLETVAEQDWVRLTQSQFDPIRIADRLWIVPSWHEAPDVDAIAIILDPGLAFGTGSHPTTRLCLQWLEANLRPGETVLDYGCGSGILAIAAVKLGAGRTVGVDIDPQAVESARDNAARNAVEADFRLSGDLPEGDYDVVVANILTNPLKALMPLLAARTRPGGRIILSGILEAQADEVAAIYAAAFVMRLEAVDEGWALLTGMRR